VWDAPRDVEQGGKPGGELERASWKPFPALRHCWEPWKAGDAW
jgi:hypothetical protein